MRNPMIATAAAVSLVLGQLTPPVLAQNTLPYPPPGASRPDQGYSGTIRCESRNRQYQRCNVRTDNRVQLARTLGGRCTQGGTWGYAADHIWVTAGCRGEFRYGYRGGVYPTPLPQPVEDFAGTLRCESRGKRYEQCYAQTNNRVELLRKLSGKCNAGRQWGFGPDYIWVNNGCRAEFGYGYRNFVPLPEPRPDKGKGPSTGLIIGGIVVAGGLLALLASKKKKSDDSASAHATPSGGPPATLSANLSSLPSASRPSVQLCFNDAARQVGATGGTNLSYDRLVSLEPGNGGWRIRAAMTATYPDESHAVELYCRATPSEIIQLDLN